MIQNKNIILARHAQTDFNSKRILQGQSINSDLNEIGIQQAHKFYTSFSHVPFDKIYVSELKRTFDSVKSLINNKIEFEILQELNEVNWGLIEGMKFEGYAKNEYINVVKRWKNGEYSARVEQGESAYDVALRLKQAIDIIMQKEKEETILLVTHNRTLKILLCILLDLEIKEMDNFTHKNMTSYHILNQGQKFLLKGKYILNPVINEKL